MSSVLNIMWTAEAWEDYVYWQGQDRKTLRRINQLIKDAQRIPFEGTEPLTSFTASEARMNVFRGGQSTHDACIKACAAQRWYRFPPKKPAVRLIWWMSVQKCTFRYAVHEKAAKQKRRSNAPMSRASKIMLLPMPRHESNGMTLQLRIAFDALRHHQGTSREVTAVAQAVLLTSFMTEAGQGLLDIELLRQVERNVLAFLDRGKEMGDWVAPQALLDALPDIVNEHDRQLREVRVARRKARPHGCRSDAWAINSP
ncbi:hypothetical protein BPMI_03214 [Candidatus Burkholderia pumila]|uniref:Toxin YoeB n=1 Tax=Candidatus Burkholderia pumila TaxID=1090375 RepID=A0ABR5HNW3_9BURK|nr:hypothetical protein BPMI_03214 [Candidatus Burkholderia pumila]